jgi:predicted RNA polymerase sigma factor
LERAGHTEQALIHFQRATEQTTSTAERDYLLVQAARLSPHPTLKD